MTGVVSGLQALSIAFYIGLELTIIEIENANSMKMVMFYFFICGIQAIIAVVVLVFVNRNDIEV